MNWLFFATVLLLATLSVCLQEEHLVPKHVLVKRDLSAADTELILKTLMSKLEKIEESELMHKKTGIAKEHYAYGPGMTEKIHTVSMEEGKLKLPMERKTMDYDYTMEKTIPLGKADYEMKEDSRFTEKDVMGLLMKLKQMSAAETLDDSYGKKEYLGYPEEKFIAEKVHLSKDPIMLEKSGKVYEDIPGDDKFSDKDVSLAESLYHMKIAGDVETYPSIKLAPLTSMQDKKIKEEKLHFESDHALHSDEAYLKKVDEIGKSLLKEESYPHLKDDDIEGYLKKAVEEDKTLFYEPKIAHPEAAFKKSAEEKAIEEWKATHKDIFAIEGGIFSDEKLKIEAEHHMKDGIAHGIDDELLKKLKTSLALDKELKIDGAHHLDGAVSHEINDELMKKLKETLGLDKELILESTLHAEGDIGHKINDELMKKLKESLGFDKELVIEGLPHAKEGLDPKMNEELLKNLKTTLALDKEFKMDSAHHLESGKTHEMEEELMKKIKASLGLDKAFKMDDAHYLEGSLLHGMKDEEIKKLKEVLGSEVAHDELLHFSKELHKEESKGEGSFAYEKAKEQVRKDAHIGLAEEELKKHLDEALSYGTKEMVHGTELMFEKGLTAEKAHGFGISMDGAFKDEILKAKETHAVDKSIGLDKEMFGGKVPMEPGFKHAIVHDSTYAAEVDKGIKFHEDELLKKEKAYEDELLKKEKAYEADSIFHKGKEMTKSAEEHHILKGEEAHILHDSTIEKHHVATGAEKGRKTLHDLKAKFFELLRRVLHMRKCHLVTMRPGELLSIVTCVSRSKDPLLCEKFAACEKKRPIRHHKFQRGSIVIKASEKCLKETIPGEMKRCTSYAPLFPSTEIPLKIFQCVAINVRELMPHEEKQMIDFEECAKVIKAESCGRFKWFRGSH